MIKVDVTLTDDTLMQLQSALAGFSGSNGGKIMPRTKAAFDMASKLIQKSWQNWAMGGSIAGATDIKNPSPNLARSIKIRRIGDFDVSIETDSPYMERIQNGRDAINMKAENSPWLNSRKTRVTQRGKNKGLPYLIIPFQWGTPNSSGGSRAHFGNTIPQIAYDIMKSRKFKPMCKTGDIKLEKNRYGEDIPRNVYSHYDRMDEANHMDENKNLTSYDKGMVKANGERHSTYFTFRIISAVSKADWVIKKVPPNDVVSAVEKQTRKAVEDLLQEGLEQELGL